MKVLITADWHLGRHTMNVDYLPYQQELLMDWLLEEVIPDRNIDLLIVAGDIFESKQPTAEALKLFSRFVSSLASRNIPAVFLAGNHDLPEIVTYMEGILARHGLHAVSAANWAVDNTRLSEFPQLIFLPHLSQYRREGRTVEEILSDLASRYPPEESFLVTHLAFLPSGRIPEGDWEVGLVPVVDPGAVSSWKLVVSGHLHGHHRPAENIVYPGSLLKYHQQEMAQRKAMVLLDLPGGLWEAIPIPQRIDMVRVKGYMGDEGGFVLEEDGGIREDGRDFLLFVSLTRPGTDLRVGVSVLDAIRDRFPAVKAYFGGTIEGTFAVPSHGKEVAGDLTHLSWRELALRYLESRKALDGPEREKVLETLEEALACMEKMEEG